MKDPDDPEAVFNIDILYVARRALFNGMPPTRLGLTLEEAEQLQKHTQAELENIALNAPHPVAVFTDSVNVAPAAGQEQGGVSEKGAVRAVMQCMEIIGRRHASKPRGGT